MQVVKGGGEMDCLFTYCVCKNYLASCSAIDKGAMIFSAAIPIGFQIANQKQ
jgi:hypothetical protein